MGKNIAARRSGRDGWGGRLHPGGYFVEGAEQGGQVVGVFSYLVGGPQFRRPFDGFRQGQQMPGFGFVRFAVFAVHRPELDVLHLGSAGHSDSRVRPAPGFVLRPVRLDSRSVVPDGPERSVGGSGGGGSLLGWCGNSPLPAGGRASRPCCTRPGWPVSSGLTAPPIHPARLGPTVLCRGVPG